MVSAVANGALVSLVNFGALGNPYDSSSLGSVLAMGLYGLYDVCLMLGARAVLIWCNSMVRPSAYEGQAKCDLDDVLVYSCKLMRWIEPCVSRQHAVRIADIPYVEEHTLFVGSADDKGGVGNPDTSVRYINGDVDKWLIVANNKNEDNDEKAEKENEDDNEEDEGVQEGSEADDEEEGPGGEGSDDDEEEDDKDDGGSGGEDDGDDENGKEDDEDGEEEDGVENEHDENDSEEERDEDEDEDEDEEPPKKRRK